MRECESGSSVKLTPLRSYILPSKGKQRGDLKSFSLILTAIHYCNLPTNDNRGFLICLAKDETVSIKQQFIPYGELYEDEDPSSLSPSL